jgi:hypothetical protein
MKAKDILVKPISFQDAARIVKECHYSGTITQNSKLHFGVFLNGKCGGCMSFGSSMDKSKIQGLVEGTGWNSFLELNRMAFADWLPKNSESRALGVALRMIKKNYPHISWVISFADGTQCGDGTIYRASGFYLTGIKENRTILQLPDGRRVTDLSLNVSGRKTGKTSGWWKKNGAKPLKGFQLRYIYFLDPEYKQRLTVPILPFSEIERRGAKMYLGKPKESVDSTGSSVSDFQSEEGGATPTSTHQFKPPE